MGRSIAEGAIPLANHGPLDLGFTAMLSRIGEVALLPLLLTLTGCASGERRYVTMPTASSAMAVHATAPAIPMPRKLESPAQAIVDAADRSAEDRALDQGRHPVQLLEFLELHPGMQVADIGAGMGYTTELLARAVAPNGVVYGQNSRFILERFAERPWSERLTKPVMKSVLRVDREFDDPLPTEARDLDLVVNMLFYHDSVWMKTDRNLMNRSIYDALRPGGAYVVIDHSGKPDSGVKDAETLHRIDEQVVRDEVQRIGFHLAAEGNFLRNPADTRDWNASPRGAGERRGTSDRFALKFVKP